MMAAIVILQLLATIFFLIDFVGDLRAAGLGAHPLVEGGPMLLAITMAAVAVLAALSYWRARAKPEAGLTTEVALILSVLVGGLAIPAPSVAAAS